MTPPDVTLAHFVTYRGTPSLWALEAAERKARAGAWLEGVCGTADAASVYATQGLESGADVLVWTSTRVGDPAAPGEFLKRRAAAENAARDLFEPTDVLWGMTRPSEYSRASRSAQVIDPFAAERAPYLVMYPFAKTAEWYLLGSETRQGMMNEHIRIGKQYADITQLLLYSFGLQDQEFVVVYETEDLGLFSRLVHELRSTEARRYTSLDTPLHTGVRLDAADWVESLG